MNTCAICRTRFEEESPAVLFISSYGAKRVLCPHCEELLDRATAEEKTDERLEAREALQKACFAVKDPEVLKTLSEILSGEVNEDAPTPEEEAEMEAVFEEIKKEDEAKAALEVPHKSSILDYIFPVVFGAALLVFVIWYFFF